MNFNACSIAIVILLSSVFMMFLKDHNLFDIIKSRYGKLINGEYYCKLCGDYLCNDNYSIKEGFDNSGNSITNYQKIVIRWCVFKGVFRRHMFIVIVNIMAFFILPFMYPLWMWVPVNSFILTVTFTREVCPLTRLENYLRTSLGMSRIGGFIGHYFIKPVKRAIKNAA